MARCVECGKPTKAVGSRCRSCASSQRYVERVPYDRQRLVVAIKDSGLSVLELERMAGVRRDYLHNVLSRRRTMPYMMLDAIACALGCHPSEFEEVVV